MKQTILILSLLSSFNAFSKTNVVCGLFDNKASEEPIARTMIDAEEQDAYDTDVATLSHTEKVSLTTVTHNGFLKVRVGSSNRYENSFESISSISTDMIIGSAKNTSFAVSLNHVEAYSNLSGVCYITGESSVAPFDKNN